MIERLNMPIKCLKCGEELEHIVPDYYALIDPPPYQKPEEKYGVYVIGEGYYCPDCSKAILTQPY